MLPYFDAKATIPGGTKGLNIQLFNLINFYRINKNCKNNLYNKSIYGKILCYNQALIFNFVKIPFLWSN